MPSHITHVLFGREVLERISLSPMQKRWFFLGCQGPDLFLHNQRRRPTSVMWGRSIHRKGCGAFIGRMERVLASRTLGWDAPEGQYILGFASHAVLDRVTHPYIHAFSAAKSSGGGEHPFLERLIDVELCSLKTGLHPAAYPFYREISFGDTPPRSLVSLLAETVRLHFPQKYSGQAELRIDNAYRDAMGLFQFTDTWDAPALAQNLQSREPHRRKRLLALFHPPDVPLGLDVLNLQHRQWHDPWEAGKLREEGFLDLYRQALDEGARVLGSLVSQPPSETGRAEELAGNENLNGSKELQRPGTGRPQGLPLSEALDEFSLRVSRSLR